jgi:hypothetical protein
VTVLPIEIDQNILVLEVGGEPGSRWPDRGELLMGGCEPSKLVTVVTVGTVGTSSLVDISVSLKGFR